MKRPKSISFQNGKYSVVGILSASIYSSYIINRTGRRPIDTLTAYGEGRGKNYENTYKALTVIYTSAAKRISTILILNIKPITTFSLNECK